jgi:ubiquinone/menaquinone biosynthesis C-methylase UbiE
VAWYRDRVFPGIYDFLMALGKIEARRAASLCHVRGEILELGIGTGLNLAHYPPSVRRITAVDPNPGMLRQLHRRLADSPLEVRVERAPAEALPFADGTFDTVVATHVLCSLPDRPAALAEVLRVLRPGGRFVFFEHGLSPDARVARWQRRLNGIQKRFACGCLLDVPVRRELAAAGFTFERLDEYYLPGEARTHGYVYDGTAIRPGVPD